ncbi:hypothetical protein TRFO_38140 [Tritrichomonas foetus]|uniref:Uncharacterized protein n=1 Tax=Tritrichomonas foetus TaxID=1144522 RepID=A0A1J4JBX7_9EUKA|nr:hypothetical protein TRFO_38140 [Tritrichomonas foetus]|eukprot:OHS95751.1 hypothetical protein TRFO_38140 [Tritrichomonas foetus]
MTAAYQPTPTKPWPTRRPRAKWPTPTEQWGIPPTEFPPTDEGSSGGMKLSTIIGISVACFVCVVLFIIAVVVICKRRGQKEQNNEAIDEKLISSQQMGVH